MAKDKSKNSGGDEFAKPSEAPAGGDGWSFTDGDVPKSGKNDGKLFLITPLREEEISDSYSKIPGTTKKIVVADIVELDEKKPARSEEHEEVYIFGGWLMGAVRGYIGERRVLGRLVKVDDKTSATGYVWKLEDADADDIGVARAYLEALNNPLAKISKDEKPAKKGKKSKAEPEAEPAKKKSKKK